MSNGNKSLSGHFEQGLVSVQELISNFHRSQICLDVEKNQYSGRNKCHL